MNGTVLTELGRRPQFPLNDISRFEKHIQSLTQPLTIDQRRALYREIVELDPRIDIGILDFVLMWAKSLRDTSFKSIQELFSVVIDNPDLSLGPDGYKFCTCVKDVIQQIQNFLTIVPEDSREKIAKGEWLPIRSIDEYIVSLGKHSCEFGTGLITLRMHRNELFLYQVSFYPSPTPVVFEIKGAHDTDKAKEIKDGVLKFKSKYGHSVSTELVLVAQEFAALCKTNLEILCAPSLWRNFGITGDYYQNACRQHRRVIEELSLSTPENIDRIVISTQSHKACTQALNGQREISNFNFSQEHLPTQYSESLIELLKEKIDYVLTHYSAFSHQQSVRALNDDERFIEALVTIKTLYETIFSIQFPYYNLLANQNHALENLLTPLNDFLLVAQCIKHGTSFPFSSDEPNFTPYKKLPEKFKQLESFLYLLSSGNIDLFFHT